MRLEQTNEFSERPGGMANRHYRRRRFVLWRAHCLLLILLSADPLCMAKWPVVSLLIKY